MFTTEFEIVILIAAFMLGATEGANLWAWVKSWFVREAAVVETKVTPGPTGGHTGP